MVKKENLWIENCGCGNIDQGQLKSAYYVVTHEALLTWASANANELMSNVLWVGSALFSILTRLLRF